jgi:hypothetical protein
MNDAFGFWFAGLADGEGCFSASAKVRPKYLPQPQFTIVSRDDDRGMQEYIRDQLGFGNVFQHKSFVQRDGYTCNPQVAFMVWSREDTGKLVELFRQYPLRSKKARDFEIWAKIVEIRNSREWRGRLTPDKLALMQEASALKDLLQQGKEYQVGKVR